jgi:sulfonate transport system permease protein
MDRRVTTLTASAPSASAASDARGDGDLVTPHVPGSSTQRRGLDLLLRVSVPVLLVGLWAWASASGALSDKVFPAPLAVWDTFITLSKDGTLWDNLSVSLRRAGLGFAIGGLLGLALGVGAGLFRLGDQLLDPTIQMLRTIPFLAIAPLLVLWFGIGELPKIIIIAAASAFPLYLNAYSGVRNVDRKVIEAGRTFGLGRLALIRHVILPEAVPSILVGLRLALAISLIALIVAEQSNAPKGLGFLMTSAQQFFQTDVLVLCILIYAVWGLAVDILVRVLERVLMPYRRKGRA